MGLRIGSITVGGLASGIQSDEIIEKLLELERRPIDLLEAQKANFEEKLEILQDLNTKTKTFRDLLRNLDNMNLLGTDLSATEEFKKYEATSSDSTIVSATASGSALPGSISVQVRQLATREREVSTGFADTDTTTIGTGNFRITIGDGEVTNITIDSSNNTLNGFVAAINDSDASVRAFILNDGDAATPYRVVIEGVDSGSDQTLDLVTGTDAGLTSTLDFAETQAAQDAILRLDPNDSDYIDITNSTNTFADAIEGVTITAHKADTSAVETIEISDDADAIVDAISALITAYNDIVDIIDEQATVDPETNRGGPLIGDSTLISLQRQLSTVVTNQIGSGDVTAAAQLGISLDTDGKMSLKESTLRSELASDFSAVASFFAGSSSFADQLRDVTDTYVNTVDGLIVTRIDGINTSISNLDDDISDAEDRIDEIETRLVQQFAALERAISGIQQQSQYLDNWVLTSLSIY